MLHDEAQPALGLRRQSSPSYWAISLRRLLRKKIGVACLSIILLMYGSGILAPLVTPYAFNDQDLSIAKQGPSIGHPFGTDRLGRDILTRIIYGLRTTVIITVVTLVTGSLAIGITMGLLAGYFGKLIDTIIMRVGEVTSAFPEIFLVLIIVSTFKAPITRWVREVEDVVGFDIVALGVVDYLVLSLALAIFSWFGMARLVRGQVLQARENQYVEAARSIGASTPRILSKHVLPNVMGPVIVMVSAGLAGVAGSEIFLSFLGIGIQPPTPSLGLMIFENGSISVLRSDPHLLLFPVLTLSLLLFTFNLLGDAVNDAFNPRAR
ncbi:MAG: peptide ABC transporter [Chloroflexi bacterium]|jgi:ABC-type dipeptide/oligopeptide/nickel transport system permease subunit|nr:peptide ABC transporter [Chloroflexota bacterium]MDP6496305.1 ABC transporter permease [Dehalococcoidia bacterium]MQG54990.1 ABC transporter permease [SAR202 cluster bacterium]|tara:strand:- start:3538 stop:4503 length:966 start_codon:yes stop_codon:yes gene_type:complete